MKRQFCCKCYETTDDYVTRTEEVSGVLTETCAYGTRTLRWHTCRACQS